jgi:GT2 family glycosyltransferase
MFSKKWQSPSHDQDHGPSRYQLWIDNYEAAIASAVAKEIALQHSGPSFSVVIMPEKGAMDQWISSISSLAHQTYHRWELIIASTPNETLREALATIEAQGHRVSWLTLKTKRHETMRTLYERSIGNWIVQLEAPVQLAPYALASFALAITKNPDAVLVYGDDDSIDDAGRRNKPFFKTDFDRIRLLGHDYLGGAACIAKVQCRRYVEELHDQSGGVTWELTLCATRDFDDAAFIHVPYVLAHHQNVTSQRRKDKRGESRVRSTRQSILEAHLKKLGKSGRVQAIDDSPYYSVSLQPDTWPSVDIIIPTRDGRVLKKCLTSLLEITDYPNFRVCLVDNGSELEDTLEQLTWAKDNFNALVIRDDGPFNYSRLNNIAVDSTSSELILLLNDDIEITNRDWLTRMVGQFEHDDVGAVGALLWYPNGTVQHGGVITGHGGAAGHAFVGRGTNDEGYWGSLRITQQLSAVTAACLLFKRQAWSEAGGLDEDLFPVAFNDIDLCLKIRARKWRVVFDPTAQLIHHESLSRGVDETERELARSAREVANFRKKWRDELLIDPFFNPNLDYASMYFEVDAHAARVLEYPGSALYVEQLLYPTGKLISRNQRYRLEVDEHGSLVLAGPSTRRYLWNAENSHETIKVLNLQHDGNITLIAESDAILWAAGTSSLAPRTMQLTDEGALVAIARDGTEYWRLEIATATEIDTP